MATILILHHQHVELMRHAEEGEKRDNRIAHPGWSEQIKIEQPRQFRLPRCDLKQFHRPLGQTHDDEQGNRNKGRELDETFENNR